MRATFTVYVDHLLALTANAHNEVAMITRSNLEVLGSESSSRWFSNEADPFRAWLNNRIRTGLEAIDRGEGPDLMDVAIPPGSPIGMIWE